jgi:hypothetical protein
MDRPIFLCSTGMTGVCALLPPAVLMSGAEAAGPEPFQIAIKASEGKLAVRFPRARMGGIVAV